MDLLQEYKELYYKELELKENMSNKIGTSITFITFLCSGHMFMWNKMLELSFVISFFPALFLLLEISSVFFTIRSMYSFYLTYFKYDYKLISITDMKTRIDYNMSLSNDYLPS